MIDNSRIKMESQSSISPPLSPSPCFLLGSPAPPFAPSIPSPPALYLSSPSGYTSCPPSTTAQQSTVTIQQGTNPPTDIHTASSMDTIVSGSSLSTAPTIVVNQSSVSGVAGSPFSLISPLTFSSSSLHIQNHQQTQELPTQMMVAHIPLNSSLSSVPLPPTISHNPYPNDGASLAPSSSTASTPNIIPSNDDANDDSNSEGDLAKSTPLKLSTSNSSSDDAEMTVGSNDSNSIISPTTNSPTSTSHQEQQQLEQHQQLHHEQQQNQQNPLKRTHDEADLDKEYVNMRRKQKIQLSQYSLPNQMLNREMYAAKPGTTTLQSRKFYLNIVPDKTVFNIDIPLCIIKKFTSDGEKLLCFSKDLKEIQLYRFLGSSPKYPSEATKNQKETIDRNFNTYFKLIYQTVIPPFNEFLCKDFSLTTACGKYFILSSYGQSINSNNNTLNRTEETFIRQSQSNSINLNNPEDITFYLVRISDGMVCDRRTFKKDVIHLAHHSGVYLYQDFFIVLSLQYQTIHIFQIKGDKFVNIRSIGPHCNEDDQLEIDTLENAEKSFLPAILEKQQKMEEIASIKPFLKPNTNNNSQQTTTTTTTTTSTTTTTTTNNNTTNNTITINNTIVTFPNHANNPNTNNTIHTATNNNTQQPPNTNTVNTTTTNINNNLNNYNNINNSDSLSYNHTLPSGNLMGIKQRFLSYLYKKAATSEDSKKALSLYYSLFPQYCNLVMWKMQSLDASHLLIKFGPIDGLLGRLADYCNQISFFVVYNMHTTEVIGVYENSNKEFAKTFEQFCEHFRACSCPSGLIKFRSTCSNNIFVREHLMKQKLAVVNARYGGETQAVKRILSALPFSPQSWNESPYFDKYLFSYDEKMISSTERPKPLVDYPIKFYSRFGGEVKFKMNNGNQDKNDRQSKKYATYIFHPYCPFIISLQHSSATNNFVANFHYKSDDLEEEDIPTNNEDTQ